MFDSRMRRDGRSIEDIGTYDAVASDESKVYSLNVDRLKYWLSVGAKPSETVASIIKRLKIQ